MDTLSLTKEAKIYTWKPHTILGVEQELNMKLSNSSKEIELNLSHLGNYKRAILEEDSKE